MGSKISIVVIILVMVVLAGVLVDVPTEHVESDEISQFKTYGDTVRERNANTDALLFENFQRTESSFTTLSSSVDFTTNPLAQNYRDIIERGVESAGANYAGAYSIVTWSCGESCQNSAIVDVRDGRIASYGIISQHGLAFSKDSTLLIINPKENTTAEQVVTDYYSMEEGELVFIAKEVSETGVLTDCIEAFMNARNVITNEVEEFTSPCAIPFGWEVIATSEE